MDTQLIFLGIGTVSRMNIELDDETKTLLKEWIEKESVSLIKIQVPMTSRIFEIEQYCITLFSELCIGNCMNSCEVPKQDKEVYWSKHYAYY